ncbi:hypothetical protein L798_06094 [Zootermopsis nevadensis]|uniref:Uncharacterized protein n=1 Tax=Zootermopsis nevadensis TaxID=136037 RepID=A0A067R9L1_ZOONE|nr:hypothetical protein L798_06094 [Zootermopsis nevadensis]
MHNEELQKLYSLPNIIRLRVRWAGHVACMGENRNAYRVLVGKPNGKRPLGRPRHRWEDNIKMGLIEIRCIGMDWIYLGQDRGQWWIFVKMVVDLQVQQNIGI